jgi:hypothetical protein
MREETGVLAPVSVFIGEFPQMPGTKEPASRFC